MTFPISKVKTIQCVFFIKEIRKTFNKVNIASVIMSKVNFLDGEPTVLPLPDDAPAEIPRIVLKANNNTCQISLRRVDFIKEFQGEEISDILLDFITASKALSEVLLNDLGFVINRIGFVVSGYLEADTSAFVKEYYIKETMSKANGFDLGFHFNLEISNTNFNKWVRVNNRENILNFIVDYNTLDNLDAEFGFTEIESLLEHLRRNLVQDGSLLFEVNVN